jgi:hypothetical protein
MLMETRPRQCQQSAKIHMTIWRSILHDKDASSSSFPSNRRYHHPVPSIDATASPENSTNDLRSVLSSWQERSHRPFALEPTPQRPRPASFTGSMVCCCSLGANGMIGAVAVDVLGPHAPSFVRSSTRKNRSRAPRYHHHGRLLPGVNRMASRCR